MPKMNIKESVMNPKRTQMLNEYRVLSLLHPHQLCLPNNILHVNLVLRSWPAPSHSYLFGLKLLPLQFVQPRVLVPAHLRPLDVFRVWISAPYNLVPLHDLHS